MHFFHLSAEPPFCFCNGARNFSDISRGGTEEEQKSVTVHYAVIIFPPPSSLFPHYASNCKAYLR